MNDVDHPVYLLGSDGSGPGLFSEEVHHVGGKLLATLSKKLLARYVHIIFGKYGKGGKCTNDNIIKRNKRK